MKIITILRLVALGVLIAALTIWAAAISAADPAGDSPQNGIPESSTTAEVCTSQTQAPGAQVWLKVPYHAGTELEMHVKDGSGVNFDVYDPSQIANYPSLPAQPTGRLLPNPNEPGYTNTWMGDLGKVHPTDYYYVLVTNTNSFQVTFSFCTIESDAFTPPPQSLPQTETSFSDDETTEP